uniref:ubiquitinyl hydrolase 1 n=1 Tax=Romanomermis culicivorax TaxID=13658 RepID=A0A915IBP7_ROMCU
MPRGALRRMMSSCYTDVPNGTVRRPKTPYGAVKQKVDTTPPGWSEGKSLIELCKEYCAQLVKKDDSVVRDNFWGVEIIVTTCTTCGNKVPVMLPISMLTLPLINEATGCDLSYCLDRFFQAQKIVRTCSKCKTNQEMTEHHFLHKLPKFPVLQLERFHREHLRSEIQKLTTKVVFSTDKPLNFDKYFVDKAAKNCKFTLNAVIKHYGSLRSGHYVAVCRKNGRWVEFDDDDVRYINETAVNEKEAYILFYGPQS